MVAAVVAVAVELFGGEFLEVARCSCIGVSKNPFHPSSYVSDTLVRVVAAAVVAVAVQLFSWEFLAVAWRGCSGVSERPLRLSSYVSGTYVSDDTWRAQFGDAAELSLWLELIRQGVDVFALDYDVLLSTMYALSVSAEGDCYRCVPPNPGIAAAALGASESGNLLGTAPAEALHTFTLDSGASCCFYHDITTLTPLPAPVPVRLADPSGGPVVARSSTVLLCPAVPSGSLSGLHLPSFSMNLVSTTALQVAMVTTTTPGGQRVSICTCQVPPACSCRLLSHQTHLWHHRLGHPSLPRLRGMHSRLLFSGLSRSLPPLPPSPAPPCLPCVEGRQRAAPHSSSFPLTTVPLQTLHMDVWGPARVSGKDRERYFLLVVDDYTRYTTVFPLRSKGQDPPVLRLHSDRGAPHWLSHGGRSYLHDPCGCSPFSVAVCGPARCASAQPPPRVSLLEVLLVRRDFLRSSCVSGLFGAHVFAMELPEVEALETLELEVLELLLELVVLEPGAAEAGGAGAGGAGAGGAGAAGVGAVDPGAGGTGDSVRPRPYFVPLLQQVLGVPSSPGLTPPLLCPPPDQSQLPLQPASPLPALSPYTEQSGGLIERREPASRPVSPVRTARRVPRSCPPCYSLEST
ncbi:unnamed protein product [Closterium sp. NIES-53]